MKKVLKKEVKLYHFRNGERVDGANVGMRGDCSGLSGDCSGLSGNCSGLIGDCSGLSGNCSGLSGNCSGLRGDCSGLSGNIDEANLTREDRERGVGIEDLIA